MATTTRHEDEVELVPKGGATFAEGGTDGDGDAQKMDGALQSTSSTYWSLLIFALIWWVGIFFFYLNVRHFSVSQRVALVDIDSGLIRTCLAITAFARVYSSDSIVFYVIPGRVAKEE